jgi:probable O-glycosylation ligase (exosortase A-associated)
MVATAFGVLGTYSRGGFIGLGVMAGYLWWRSKHRIALALAIIAVVVPALLMMPQSWYQRMGTLKEASSQQTFQTRLDAWKVNWNIAVARPLTGGGFNASEDPDTYRIYSYGKSIYAGPGNYKTPAGFTGGHAAHSIYLEVLGDHGFIGLGIYLAMLIATWSLLGRVRKSSKGLASLEWVEELATMVQVSFVAFFVSGFALSMAYYDLVFLFMGITLALSVVVGDFKEDARAAVVPSRVPDAVKRGKWRAPALNPT